MVGGTADTRKAAVTLVQTGVPGAFNNVRSVIAPLYNDVHDLIHNTLILIRDNSFIPVYDLIDFAYDKLNQSELVLDQARVLLNQTDALFSDLQQTFTVLKQYEAQGYISGVPDNTTVPNVNNQTSTVLADAQTSLNDIHHQVNNLTTQVDDAKAKLYDNSTNISDLYRLVNDSVNTALNGVNSTETSFNNMQIQQKINSYYDKYVPMFNEIRLPVMIVLLIVPIILFALWFVGAATGKYKLMLVGFWWAAATCWLIMILAAVHIILFIPVKDMCNNRDNLIRQGASEFLFKNGTDYASTFGITSPPEAVSTINSAVSALLAKPDIILDCNGDTSIVTALNIDLPAIFNISGRLDDAKAQIRAQADAINVTGRIQEIQPIFESMDNRIMQVRSNVTAYNQTAQNYLSSYDAFLAVWNSSQYWNASTQAQAQAKLDDLNSMTGSPTALPTPHNFTFSDIGNFNSSNYPTFTPAQKNQADADASVVVDLVKLNQTVMQIDAELAKWGTASANVSLLVTEADEILKEVYNLEQSAWKRVNDSVTLPDQIIASIFSYLDPAIAAAIELARMPNLGKCKFIGDFIRSGFKKGVCTEIGSAAGGIALCILLASIMWLVMWPIILSSKAHYASLIKKPKSDEFFEMEDVKKA